MNWDEVTMSIVGATVAVIIGRLLIVAGYGRGTSRLLTFYLPTLALLALALQSFLTRTVTAWAPGGWAWTICWGAILATQLVAAAHAWIPRWPSRPESGDEVPVHDAQVLAKLEDVETAVDKLTEARQP